MNCSGCVMLCLFKLYIMTGVSVALVGPVHYCHYADRHLIVVAVCSTEEV